MISDTNVDNNVRIPSVCSSSGFDPVCRCSFAHVQMTVFWNHCLGKRSVVLGKYLEHSFEKNQEMKGIIGSKILELGSGTGLVSIAAACLGAQVWATDLEYSLENLRTNARRNSEAIQNAGGILRVEELDWKNPKKSAKNIPFSDLDFVLASDVIWVEWLIQPLVQTLDYILSSSSEGRKEMNQKTKTSIILSHQTRSKASDVKFFTKLRNLDMRWKEIESDQYHPKFAGDGKIKIFKIDRLTKS
mmetsp:Transcript_27720/g.38716  ORF Transcript_27720/g.38716 Transcript_27720/m.38716 type:complete len:245 (+) Transcript_27720:254-988(+)